MEMSSFYMGELLAQMCLDYSQAMSSAVLKPTVSHEQALSQTQALSQLSHTHVSTATESVSAPALVQFPQEAKHALTMSATAKRSFFIFVFVLFVMVLSIVQL